MKLVITAPWGRRLGGAEQSHWTFLRHVDRSEIAPMVVFLEPGPFVDDVAGLGIATVVIPTGRLREIRRTARSIVRLARLLRREQPDHVLSWTTKSHVSAATAAVLAGYGARCSWWQHGFTSGALLDRVATALPTRAVFCPSLASAESQQRLWPRRRTIVVHPCVEIPPDSPTDATAVLGLASHSFLVGIVGRLQPWKRQDLVIEATAELARRGVDVHLLVVGGEAHGLSPEYAPALGALVARLGLEDHVTFTGHVQDPVPYVRAMDVLVNASAREPFGLVLLEAMAVSTPVVAFAAGGPLEIVEPEVSGVLLSGEPRAALVDALARLAADPQLRRRLAEAGRDRFDAEFSAERLTRKLSDDIVRLARGDEPG